MRPDSLMLSFRTDPVKKVLFLFFWLATDSDIALYDHRSLCSMQKNCMYADCLKNCQNCLENKHLFEGYFHSFFSKFCQMFVVPINKCFVHMAGMNVKCVSKISQVEATFFSIVSAVCLTGKNAALVIFSTKKVGLI